MAPILTGCCAAPSCAVPKANSATPRTVTTPLCENIPPPQAHAAFNIRPGRMLPLTAPGTMTHEKMDGPRHDGMGEGNPIEALARQALGGFPRWAVTGRFVR